MEQRPIQEQQKALESRVDIRRAPPSSYPWPLQLTEPLQISLLAVANRYPSHSVDMNEAVLGLQPLGAEGWRALDLIELLQHTAPELLHEESRLEVTTQRRGIYLLELSEQLPAFWLHCGEEGEKMPDYRGGLASRQAEQMQERDKKMVKLLDRVIYLETVIEELQCTIRDQARVIEQLRRQLATREAERPVERFSGVRGVSNLIVVRSHPLSGDLKQQIEQALVRNAQTDAQGITVEVQGSKVILRGTVRSYAEKQAAEEVVRSALGVGQVDNRIVISLRP